MSFGKSWQNQHELVMKPMNCPGHHTRIYVTNLGQKIPRLADPLPGNDHRLLRREDGRTRSG